jgi:hypothetical protein
MKITLPQRFFILTLLCIFPKLYAQIGVMYICEGMEHTDSVIKHNDDFFSVFKNDHAYLYCDCSHYPDGKNLLYVNREDTSYFALRFDVLNGSPCGRWTWFYPTGENEKIITQVNSKIQVVFFYRNGNVLEKYCGGDDEWMKEGKGYNISGDDSIFYKNGKVVAVTHYDQWYLNGAFKIWYGSGQVKEEGFYKHSRKDSTDITYYPNGQVMKKCFYRDDKMDGHWEEFDQLGNKTFEGEYINGEAQTPWKICHHYTKDEMQSTLIDNNFDSAYAFNFDGSVACVLKYDKVGYINRKGKLVVPMIYDDGVIDYIDNGLIRVTVNGAEAIIDSVGNYVTAFDMNHENITVTSYRSTEHNGKPNYLDAKGHLVFSDTNSYDRIDVTNDGKYFMVKKDTLYGLIDSTEKILLPLKYKYMDEFSPYTYGDNHGIFIATKAGEDKSIIVWANGQEYIPEMEITTYDQYVNLGVTQGEKNGKYGFVDTHGKSICDSLFDQVGGFEEDSLAFVRNGNKWGAINRKGKLVIPFLYDEWKTYDTVHGYLISEPYYKFFHGCAPVRLNGKWGVINKKGEIYLPFIYDYVFQDWLGNFYVKKDGKMGLLAHNKKIILPLVFQDISEAEGDVDENFVTVWTGDSVGIYTMKGKRVIMTDSASYWNRDVVFVLCTYALKYYKNGKCGFYDINGKKILDPIYDHISFIYEEKWGVVYNDDHLFYINLKGQKMLTLR